MRIGKGYNSVVECHLDVVKVISSKLIIPKPNVSSSLFISVRSFLYREKKEARGFTFVMY